MVVRVVVVRHGERLDEADKQLWRSTRTQETLHDPPLTSTGWDQAQAAGREIAKVLPGECQMTMYSSPTARTLSTAAGLAKSIGCSIATITPVYSLNCCAAAQSHGVAKAFPKKEPDQMTTGGFALACWPPMGDAAKVDKRQGGGGGFVEAVKEIASLHQDGDVVVMVSHREGIWQLHRHVGTRGRGGYCNTSYYNYDSSSNSLTSWDPSAKPLHANVTGKAQKIEETSRVTLKKLSMAALARRAEAAGASEEHMDEAKNTDDTQDAFIELILKHENKTAVKESVNTTTKLDDLQALLASGSGVVRIARADSTGATLLWRTPGVRGVWADGGAVPNGELVTLLSSPQTSEGKEGDFVLVQRPTGHEGWTKVKNVRLP